MDMAETKTEITRLTCKNDNCEEYPAYNIVDGTADRYCVYCMYDENVDINGIQCKKCKTLSYCNSYGMYCMFCFMDVFPEHKFTTKTKSIKQYMVGYIMEEFPEYNWINKKLDKYNDLNVYYDLLLELNDKIFIIDIVVDQYNTDYNRSHTVKVVDKPIVILKFNTDRYVNDKNEIITSSIDTRLDMLKTYIVSCINKPVTKLYNSYMLYHNSYMMFHTD